MFKRLLNHCTITLTLDAQEPHLIKSGGAVVSGPDMAFVRTQRHGTFQPFLPGSSLKGVLRSHAERIARTLHTGSVCHVFEKRQTSGIPGCGTRQRQEAVDTSTEDKISQPADYKNSCPACRLFGSLHWKGRFQVTDAYLLPEYEHIQPELRDGIGIDRVTGGAAGGAKFDLEVMPAGVYYSTRIDVVNFELWQLGWLAYVLRDLCEGYLRFGLGTSRGFGGFRAQIEDATLAYTGTPTVLTEQVVGIGALMPEAEGTAYGLRADDVLPLASDMTFTRPRGMLRSQHHRTGHTASLDLLSHLSSAWDNYVPHLTTLPQA